MKAAVVHVVVHDVVHDVVHVLLRRVLLRLSLHLVPACIHLPAAAPQEQPRLRKFFAYRQRAHDTRSRPPS